jgi:hypothetical protein
MPSFRYATALRYLGVLVQKGRGAAATLLTVLVLILLARGIVIPTVDQWRWIASSANLIPAAILTTCAAVSVILRGVRWHVLLSPGVALKREYMVAGFGWCFLVFQTIPFRAGEPYREMWIKLRGGSATQAATSAVLDRLIDAVTICLILMIALV